MTDYAPLYSTCGRVGRSPERKTLTDGRIIASFVIAEMLGYGNEKDATRWVDVSVFKPEMVDLVMDSVEKGQVVAIVGTALKERAYNERIYYSTIAHRIGRVEFLVPGAARAPEEREEVEDF